MGRSIVLEWDSKRALGVTGKVGKGTRPVLTRAFGFELPGTNAAGEPAALIDMLSQQLASERVGKGEATVIVERTAAEMRMLTVPPVPAEELPQVVRFQAGREFSNLAEGWLLDFVPLTPTANGQQRVLAAAISPQVATQIRGCCDKAGLELKRVMLRPFAVARLLKRAGRLAGNLLLIERLAESIEMTILCDANVQLTRSVRISSEASAEALANQTLGEVRRTLGSFRNQQASGEVQRVLLIADGELNQQLLPKLKDLNVGDVEIAHAWDLFEAGGTAQAEAPADAYRYCGVLGALDDPTPDPATEIDFVNPTRPPAPPSNRTKYIIAGVAIAALVVSAGALYWLESTRLATQLNSLRAEVDAMREKDQDYRARMAEVDLLDQWMLGKVDWSSEISHISRRLPMPDDAIVETMSIATDPATGLAKVTIKGKLSTPDMLGRIEQELRDSDSGREISGRKINPAESGTYRWDFDETITLHLTRLRELKEKEFDEAYLTRAQTPSTSDASTPSTSTPASADSASAAEPAETTEVESGSRSTPPATSDEPSSDEPSSDEPSSDEPSSDEPSSDEPSSDEPSSDEPSSDEPSSDEPSSDEPAALEPTRQDDEPSSRADEESR